MNRIREAELAFSAYDLEGRRGLGWIAHLTGERAALVTHWGRIIETAPEHWSAAACFPRVLASSDPLDESHWLYRLASTHRGAAGPILREALDGTLPSRATAEPVSLPRPATNNASCSPTRCRRGEMSTRPIDSMPGHFRPTLRG